MEHLLGQLKPDGLAIPSRQFVGRRHRKSKTGVAPALIADRREQWA
jgi:hypothetical protein